VLWVEVGTTAPPFVDATALAWALLGRAVSHSRHQPVDIRQSPQLGWLSLRLTCSLGQAR
jgi:hypothetical protein